MESKGSREMETRKGWTMVIVGILISLMIGISAAPAASDYPTRYIDLIVPYSPGGATDGIARLYKDKVEKLLGQPFSFVYKPGAGGTIAGSYVKESKSDGYTLLRSAMQVWFSPR
jgi:tripartite-type tricarboxylate transporter receptor subunit TctC